MSKDDKARMERLHSLVSLRSPQFETVSPPSRSCKLPPVRCISHVHATVLPFEVFRVLLGTVTLRRYMYLACTGSL